MQGESFEEEINPQESSWTLFSYRDSKGALYVAMRLYWFKGGIILPFHSAQRHRDHYLKQCMQFMIINRNSMQRRVTTYPDVSLSILLITLGNNICATFTLSPMIKVWVGGLGEEGTRLELEVAFEEFGPVKNIWIAKNPPSFAFIEMEVRSLR